MSKSLFFPIVSVAILAPIAISASIPIGAPITSVEINGIDDTKLIDKIPLKRGDFYSPKKIEAAKKAIIKYFEKRGHYGTIVEVKLIPVNHSVAVKFNVTKGDKIKIRKVSFSGNKHISSSILEKNLVNKKGGLFGFIPIFGGGTAVPEQLPYDQMRIREVYLENGYLDVRVGEPLMKVDFASNQADVTYSIIEGPQYKVSKITIDGNVPGLNKDELYDELNLRSDRVFNVKKLRKDLALLKRKVGDLGYAFAQIKPEFHKNAQNHTVSITYHIYPGKKVYVNDVIISGNKKTMDYVIRRYIYLTPGEIFRYTDLEDTKKELQRTGFFDKVVVKPQRVSEDKINIVVEVEEAQTGRIAGGLGYGSYDGFMINGSISDRNLFGTGISASLSVDLSQKSTNYSLSFKDPRIFDSLFSLSFGVYHTKDEFDFDNSNDYTVKRAGGWFTFGRKITREMHASIGYSYNDVKYSDYEDVVDHPETFESYKKSSIISSFTYDSTDDYYVPRHGIYSKISLEYAGLGGDVDFVKSKIKFATYYGLEQDIDYDLILRYKFKGGYISSDGYTPLAEMFYLGGARKGVRGFSPSSLSPFYISNGDKVRVGGDQILVNSIEASIPLDMITPNMRLTAFFDYGMIKNTIYKGDDIQRGWIDRYSVGAQIEWKSPFGPINFIFAQPLNDKKGDDTSVFEFTMGSKF